MKVKIERLTEHDFLATAVLNMMTSRFDKYKIVPGVTKEVELKLTLNGVELNFQKFMDELDRQHGRMVEDCANAMLKDVGVDGLRDTLETLRRDIEDKIEQVFPNFKREDRW